LDYYLSLVYPLEKVFSIGNSDISKDKIVHKTHRLLKAPNDKVKAIHQGSLYCFTPPNPPPLKSFSYGHKKKRFKIN